MAKKNFIDVTGNREYKSDVFCMLMEYPEYALNVYNALCGSNYTDVSLVKIVTMRKGISLSVRNDAAFVINNSLHMYEHQSTDSPNMPLRSLIYFTQTIEEFIKEDDIYGKRLIKLPTPHFVVFYNGEAKRPEKEILKLSDAFINQDENTELELIVTVYNINCDNNKELLEKSNILYEYMLFVDKVRAKKKEYAIATEADYGDAVEAAVDECIKEGILKDFLISRKNEVIKAMTLDYTFERRAELMKKESYSEGFDDGIESKLINQIAKKLAKGKNIATIADELEESEETVRELIENNNLT